MKTLGGNLLNKYGERVFILDIKYNFYKKS